MPRPSNLPIAEEARSNGIIIALEHRILEVPVIVRFIDEKFSFVVSPNGLPEVIPEIYTSFGSTILGSESQRRNVNIPPIHIIPSNIPKKSSRLINTHWIVQWNGEITSGTQAMNLYRSLDLGENWELSLEDVQPFNENVGIPVIGSDGILWSLTDQTNKGLSVEIGRVYKSLDNGDSWEQTSLEIDLEGSVNYEFGTLCGIVVDPNNPNKVIVAGVKVDLGSGSDYPVIWITEDSGENWEERLIVIDDEVVGGAAGGYNIGIFPNGKIIIVSQVFILGSSPSIFNLAAIISSSSELDNWEVFYIKENIGAGFDPINGSVQVIDDEKIICTFNEGFVFDEGIDLSSDAGETWIRVILPEPYNKAGAYYDLNEDYLYVVKSGVSAVGNAIPLLIRLSQPFDGNQEWEDLTERFVESTEILNGDVRGWYGVAITAA